MSENPVGIARKIITSAVEIMAASPVAAEFFQAIY
jgi:hypothetical protein